MRSLLCTSHCSFRNLTRSDMIQNCSSCNNASGPSIFWDSTRLWGKMPPADPRQQIKSKWSSIVIKSAALHYLFCTSTVIYCNHKILTNMRLDDWSQLEIWLLHAHIDVDVSLTQQIIAIWAAPDSVCPTLHSPYWGFEMWNFSANSVTPPTIEKRGIKWGEKYINNQKWHDTTCSSSKGVMNITSFLFKVQYVHSTSWVGQLELVGGPLVHKQCPANTQTRV